MFRCYASVQLDLEYVRQVLLWANKENKDGNQVWSENFIGRIYVLASYKIRTTDNITVETTHTIE